MNDGRTRCMSRALPSPRTRSKAPTAQLRTLVMALLATAVPHLAGAQHLLVPMDDAQRNHLKAYGLAFAVLKAERKSEWFLNYRGGAFLIPDLAEFRKRSALDGVTVEPVSDGDLAAIRAEMAGGNMESVVLERAPRIAIYTPPNSPPWDDAVTLALQYAGIEFTKVWDEDVLGDGLAKIDWLHLFHEDFTGQLNKLHIAYRDQPWYLTQRQQALGTARKLGYANIPALKKAVADHIRSFVDKGGFLFAMCGATETLDPPAPCRRLPRRSRYGSRGRPAAVATCPASAGPAA